MSSMRSSISEAKNDLANSLREPLSVQFARILLQALPLANKATLSLISFYTAIYCEKTTDILYGGDDFKCMRNPCCHTALYVSQSDQNKKLILKKRVHNRQPLSAWENEADCWNKAHPLQPAFLWIDSNLIPILIMPFFGSATLGWLLEDHSISATLQFKLFLAAASALKRLHCSGITHGDIDKDNICYQLGPQNELVALYIDFGNASKSTERRNIFDIERFGAMINRYPLQNSSFRKAYDKIVKSDFNDLNPIIALNILIEALNFELATLIKAEAHTKEKLRDKHSQAALAKAAKAGSLVITSAFGVRENRLDLAPRMDPRTFHHLQADMKADENTSSVLDKNTSRCTIA